MGLSQHFTLEEFIYSAKGAEMDIDNTPNALQIARMKAWCDSIGEPIRAHFKSAVHILSGFRCPELNKLVGGANTSQHLLGEAADIHVFGVDNDDLWKFITLNLNFDQCIAEKLHRDNGNAGWVHVSHRREGKQRNEALSFLGNGQYVQGLQYIN
jgi:zinc D-Ala-D-Ala carboxypeptidase